ncbi:MAG: tetratricopeptide repeat protein [Anaerolineae bacterium]|nr:tetratricopeptide repeat protein [Anaerolineae bacterium]
MKTYEFWNEMDTIFEAIVAYQEKTIEFNKRFINPWVKLGNVFDKQESNEEIAAHKNAIEIDPENAHNWYELASAYTRTGNFDKSIQAYQKAIELGFESGELYKNLALAHAMTGKHQDAIPIFEKALNLLEKDEDKAVVWNHLGNVCRKLNDYEMALQAFQQADQLESEQSTIAKELTDETVTPADESNASQKTNDFASVMDNASSLENPGFEDTNYMDLDVEQTEVGQDEEKRVRTPAECTVDEIDKSVAKESEIEETDDEDDSRMPVILDLDYSTDSPTTLQDEMIADETEDADAPAEKPQEDFVASLEREADEAPVIAEAAEEELELEGQDAQEAAPDVPANAEQTSKPMTPTALMLENDEDVDVNTDLPASAAPTVEEGREEATSEESVDTSEIENGIASSQKDDAPPVLSAYEEYLRDHSNPDPDNVCLPESELEETQTIAMTPSEGKVANSKVNIDVNTDLTVDMDTKNAHVWNELGNVYFNAGSFDDAIAAYSKAIELDTHFAWTYTNLALCYVQKGRLDEAVLLYQRSIELFSNENDMAVTWNRLGNVYRRLNDYENAISAYQRADELDPGNAAITQQSRFSLLGSEAVNQEAGYSV